MVRFYKRALIPNAQPASNIIIHCPAEFKAYFEKFGKVVTAEVMFNRETHKSRGFGFIVYEVERSAELVCIEKEHVIDGKVVSNDLPKSTPSKIKHNELS